MSETPSRIDELVRVAPGQDLLLLRVLAAFLEASSVSIDALLIISDRARIHSAEAALDGRDKEAAELLAVSAVFAVEASVRRDWRRGFH
jgi:hypothetical protein